MRIKINIANGDLTSNPDMVILRDLSPEYAEKAKRQMERAYIELDTGGDFDDLPLEAQAHLKKGMEIFLRSFACYLLAAINTDRGLRGIGIDTCPGINAVAKGLDVISENLEKANNMILS